MISDERIAEIEQMSFLNDDKPIVNELLTALKAEREKVKELERGILDWVAQWDKAQAHISELEKDKARLESAARDSKETCEFGSTVMNTLVIPNIKLMRQDETALPFLRRAVSAMSQGGAR